MSSAAEQRIPHISVCVCTFKRAQMLTRLLNDLVGQETGGLFTFSVVIADNDEAGSAESTIEAFCKTSTLEVKYFIETKRGIANARNKVVTNADGDYLAFIDDDEFPAREWLLTALKTCIEYGSDGVLGPVKRHFDVTPPRWMSKSRFYDRRVDPTGKPVVWNEARTGNVLLKRCVIEGDPEPFRPQFRAGEDQDFFRRKIEAGFKFVWCAEAEAFETVPPARWKRAYLIKKALLRGASAGLQPSCDAASIAKSMLAIPLYILALPFALVAGHHHFMTLVVKLCDHSGKLLILMGINPIRGEYVSD